MYISVYPHIYIYVYHIYYNISDQALLGRPKGIVAMKRMQYGIASYVMGLSS